MIQYLLEYNRYMNLIGIGVIILVGWLLSRRRSSINFKLVGTCFSLQVLFGFLMLRTSTGITVVQYLANGICSLYAYTQEGTKFIFGPLAEVQAPWGCVFAFRILPVMIFFGAFIALLFHFKIIQVVTAPLTKLLYRLLGTSAAETLVAVANSFLGQTEAPLLIKDYLPKLTRSEMLTVMVAGMGTISAPLFAVYASFSIPISYILASSIMAIPSTILISKMLLPETEETATKHGLHIIEGADKHSVFDALSEGTTAGLNIALAVGAMLIAFIALIACTNGILGGFSAGIESLINFFGAAVKIPVITIQVILGIVFAPIAWLFGLTGHEIIDAGQLLGIKIALNEMIAYASLQSLHLSERAVALLSFALCGFANFASIGMQIAGIGSLAPNQRKTLGELGLLAVLGGTMSTLLSAFIAGLLL